MRDWPGTAPVAATATPPRVQRRRVAQAQAVCHRLLAGPAGVPPEEPANKWCVEVADPASDQLLEFRCRTLHVPLHVALRN